MENRRREKGGKKEGRRGWEIRRVEGKGDKGRWENGERKREEEEEERIKTKTGAMRKRKKQRNRVE